MIIDIEMIKPGTDCINIKLGREAATALFEEIFKGLDEGVDLFSIEITDACVIQVIDIASPRAPFHTMTLQ